MSYLYGFTKYAGSDKIWKVDWCGKQGDLLSYGDDYYICLGDEIPFFEQYVYEIREPESKFNIVEKKFLSKENIEFINYMVYQRYSPYYNVMKYFLPQDIDKLIDRKITKKNKISSNFGKILLNEFSNIDISNEGQTLIVFPDLWTLINLADDLSRKEIGVDTLLSTNTQNQKDKSWRNIKNGNTKIILATHSEIFQNFNDLKKIIILYPHKRYYSNQQDPRYKTLAVVQKMSEIYSCGLEIIEN